MLARVLLAFAMTLFALCGVKAHEHVQYTPEYNEWAIKQLVNPEAGQRMACATFSQQNASCFCCHGSEIVKTKFRPLEIAGVPYPEDGWDWLNPKSGKWEHVPDDTIHWDEATPTKEAVIFVLNGIVRCFFPPQDGGG